MKTAQFEVFTTPDGMQAQIPWTPRKWRWWLFLLADARALTGESASATGLPNEQRNSLRNAAKTSRSGCWLAFSLAAFALVAGVW